jgi:N-methylhydantoinase A/oxoprolinase/acetone carboxylase beta subunit
LLADRHPDVLIKLPTPVSQQLGENSVAQFLIPWKRPTKHLSDKDMALLSRIEAEPLALLSSEMRDDWMFWQRIEGLEKMCLVQRAAFTPTDALHALGWIQRWNEDASRLGAKLFATQLNLSVNTFCEEVIRRVSNQVVKELVSKILEEEAGPPEWEKEPTAAWLMGRALDKEHDGDLGCKLELKRPLVALGAPVKAYMPRAAERLHTKLLIPPNAEVANAVGAVAGGVIQHVRVLISPLNSAGQFRLHLPDGVRDFGDLEEAVLYANQAMSPYAEALAHQAGAGQVEVKMVRKDRRVKLNLGCADEIYLYTEIVFTAVGRPSVAAQ